MRPTTYRAAALIALMGATGCGVEAQPHEPASRPVEVAQPASQAAAPAIAAAPSSSAEVHPYEQPGLPALPQLFSAKNRRSAGSWRRRRSLSAARFREKGACREYGLLGPRLNRILRVCRGVSPALVRTKLPSCGERGLFADIEFGLGKEEDLFGEEDPVGEGDDGYATVTELFERGAGGWRRLDGCRFSFVHEPKWPTVKLDGRGDPIVWLAGTYNAGQAAHDEVGMLLHASGRLRALAGMSLSNFRRRGEPPVGTNLGAGGESGGCTFKRSEIVCELIGDEVSETWPERRGLLHRYAYRWRFRVHHGSGALVRVGPKPKRKHLKFAAKGPWRNVACGEERWTDLISDTLFGFSALLGKCAGRTCKVGPTSLHTLPKWAQESFDHPKPEVKAKEMTIVATGAYYEEDDSAYGRLRSATLSDSSTDELQVVAQVCVQRRLLPDAYSADGWDTRGLQGHPETTGPMKYRYLYRRLIRRYKVIK